ncbi:hypothetical protein K5X82_16050 [Halosquirtibacter xylanolyticus]|uniref:hypothetical protein n=1 Tax=Halosquirtibacter xylanolyticus TaxID=3374599 RepID=UPI003748A595|nr:hypothetical protein K5X82_16050 [Prolixibacteraceae bacterium]
MRIFTFICFFASIVMISSCSLLRNNKGYTPIEAFAGDTLQYIKTNFDNRKEAYVGKKFKYFLKDINVPLNSYFADFVFKGEMGCEGVSFFVNENVDGNGGSKPIIVHVKWERLLPSDEPSRMERDNGQTWTKQESGFYKGIVIKDICTTEWGTCTECAK